LSNLLIIAHVYSVIGTGLQACLAGVTGFFVDEHKAILALVNSLGGTGLHTRRIDTVHTKYGEIIHG
jgi:hypothetical protein